MAPEGPATYALIRVTTMLMQSKRFVDGGSLPIFGVAVKHRWLVDGLVDRAGGSLSAPTVGTIDFVRCLYDGNGMEQTTWRCYIWAAR